MAVPLPGSLHTSKMRQMIMFRMMVVFIQIIILSIAIRTLHVIRDFYVRFYMLLSMYAETFFHRMFHMLQGGGV